MTENTNEDLIHSMYAQSEEEDGPNEQPIQLRLAGKATIAPINGQQVAIPKIEYVELLERKINELLVDSQKTTQTIRRLEREIARLAKASDRKINAVSEKVTKANAYRFWD